MAWTPADLGAALLGWWEARDLLGVVADGGAVSNWSDKSSHGRNLTQATSANQPTFLEAGRHNHAALRGAGSACLANTALGSPFHGLTSGYISFIFSAPLEHTAYVAAAPNSTGGGNGVDLGLGSGVVGYLRSDTGSFAGATSAVSYATTGLVTMAESSWDFAKVGGELTIIGGDYGPASATVAGSSTAAALGEFNVMDFQTGWGSGLKGDLYAAIIANRPLTAEELRQWRLYACRNWRAVSMDRCLGPTVGYIGPGL